MSARANKNVPVQVVVSRDGVAAGDDFDAHEREVDIDGRRKLFAFIGEMTNERYLPLIQGGHAVWVVRASRRGRALAVVAQHWDWWEPAEMLVDSDAEIATIGEAIHFEYWAQEDVAATLAELRSDPGVFRGRRKDL